MLAVREPHVDAAGHRISTFGDRTPDENTIRHFRNHLTETGMLKRVMKAFD
jgi:hypothetical protein